MTVKQIKILVLPSFEDPDSDDKVSCAADLGAAKAFISGSYPTFSLKPDASHTGNYTVTVTLSDDNPLMQSTVYTFLVTVNPEPVKEVKNTTSQNADGLTVVLNPDEKIFKLTNMRQNV